MKNVKYAGNTGKRALLVCLLFAMCVGGCMRREVPTDISPTPIPFHGVTEGVTPEPVTAEPVAPSPEPTKEPVTEATPTPSAEPLPTPEPLPTATPESTVTPEPLPTATPESTVTPELLPTEIPESTVTPEPLPTEIPESTTTPEPLPTNAPDYGTLLQNGWQRTEDFFGCREIVFPGIFNRTELMTKEGYYEYRYTTDNEDGLLFRIVGEDEVGIQPFLDELEQVYAGCVVVPEGAEDYRYSYTEEDTMIKGRVYACNAGERKRRMRIEFCYPAEEAQAEGYEFYLR